MVRSCSMQHRWRLTKRPLMHSRFTAQCSCGTCMHSLPDAAQLSCGTPRCPSRPGRHSHPSSNRMSWGATCSRCDSAAARLLYWLQHSATAIATLVDTYPLRIYKGGPGCPGVDAAPAAQVLRPTNLHLRWLRLDPQVVGSILPAGASREWMDNAGTEPCPQHYHVPVQNGVVMVSARGIQCNDSWTLGASAARGDA